MIYRIGPNALADDMFSKMQQAGLELVHVHAPYFPNGFEGAIGVDRVFNHEKPVHTFELPVILVVDVIITVSGQRYRSYTNGYYWTSALIVPAGSPTPHGYRQMTKGEGICALAQYPTIRSLQLASAMCFTDEVYFDHRGRLTMQATADPWAQHTGYVPLATQGSTRDVCRY